MKPINRMIVRPTVFRASTFILSSVTNSSLAQIRGIPTLDDLTGSWRKASELRSPLAVNSILFADGFVTTPLFSKHAEA